MFIFSSLRKYIRKIKSDIEHQYPKCKHCGHRIGKNEDVIWIKNYTRNTFFVLCAVCNNDYCKKITDNGGSVTIESDTCRHCGANRMKEHYHDFH